MGLVKNFLFNYVPLAIVVTVHKNIYFIFTCVSSGTCWNKKYFNYVPLTWISLELLIWIQNIFPCKQWDLLNENSTMSHWTEYLLLYILIFYIYKICKQWDLLNCKNSTMSHWKKSLFTFLFKLKIDSCKQWDLLKWKISTMSHWLEFI